MGMREDVYLIIGFVHAVVCLVFGIILCNEFALILNNQTSLILSDPMRAFLSVVLFFEMLLITILCFIKGMEEWE